MIKHADVEVSRQSVKINAKSKEVWDTNYPVHLAQRRDINMAECATSQVAIQRLKLKGLNHGIFELF